MSAWYLLWMFFDVVGLLGLCVATPFIWGYACEQGTRQRAGSKLLYWKVIRAYAKRAARPAPMRPCLYCGVECKFGPYCANRDLEGRA